MDTKKNTDNLIYPNTNSDTNVATNDYVAPIITPNNDYQQDIKTTNGDNKAQDSTLDTDIDNNNISTTNDNTPDANEYNSLSASCPLYQLRPRKRRMYDIDSVAIEINNIISSENVIKDNTLYPVLKGITFDILENDVYGISSSEINETKILCEILGNMRIFYSGQINIKNIPYSKTKRKITDYTFYIDSGDMLSPDLNALDQLMFSFSKIYKKIPLTLRKKNLLDLLCNNGLKSIALTPIRYLKECQKIMLATLIAGGTNSKIIILNLTNTTFEHNDIVMLESVVDYLRLQGKTVIIASPEPKLIGMVCDKVLFIHQGTVLFRGSVVALTCNWDRVLCIIEDNNIAQVQEILSSHFPQLYYSVKDTYLFVKDKSINKLPITDIYNALASNKIVVKNIKLNTGRVKNSFEELINNYEQ